MRNESMDQGPARGSLHRRHFLGLSAGLAMGGAPGVAPALQRAPREARRERPLLVGSANALAGMELHYPKLLEGADALDVVIDVVKVVEADPEDTSVGLGGLPNELGVVQLDAAVMDASTHNAGAVACIENILHPSEVARLVMERTDHCLLVGRGAYDFARAHGHPHVELLTDRTRRIWLEWKESMSERDDWLPPRSDRRQGALEGAPDASWLAHVERVLRERPTGTVHCSGLSRAGRIACTTSTSGLAWKIPGRVGDSPIVGAGLYCDAEGGSAGGTGRGESAILACASAMCVEEMRRGATPLEAGLEVLRRVARQTLRQAAWQPSLVEDGRPSFDLKLYLLGLDGSHAGVSLKGAGSYAVADPEGGPRLVDMVTLPA